MASISRPVAKRSHPTVHSRKNSKRAKRTGTHENQITLYSEERSAGSHENTDTEQYSDSTDDDTECEENDRTGSWIAPGGMSSNTAETHAVKKWAEYNNLQQYLYSFHKCATLPDHNLQCHLHPVEDDRNRAAYSQSLMQILAILQNHPLFQGRIGILRMHAISTVCVEMWHRAADSGATAQSILSYLGNSTLRAEDRGGITSANDVLTVETFRKHMDDFYVRMQELHYRETATLAELHSDQSSTAAQKAIDVDVATGPLYSERTMAATSNDFTIAPSYPAVSVVDDHHHHSPPRMTDSVSVIIESHPPQHLGDGGSDPFTLEATVESGTVSKLDSHDSFLLASDTSPLAPTMPVPNEIDSLRDNNDSSSNNNANKLLPLSDGVPIVTLPTTTIDRYAHRSKKTRRARTRMQPVPPAINRVRNAQPLMLGEETKILANWLVDKINDAYKEAALIAESCSSMGHLLLKHYVLQQTRGTRQTSKCGRYQKIAAEIACAHVELRGSRAYLPLASTLPLNGIRISKGCFSEFTEKIAPLGRELQAYLQSGMFMWVQRLSDGENWTVENFPLLHSSCAVVHPDVEELYAKYEVRYRASQLEQPRP